MYKAKLIYDSGNRDDLDRIMNMINEEKGNIISTSASNNFVYIFYEVPEVT
jgi:hypothetical protein